MRTTSRRVLYFLTLILVAVGIVGCSSTLTQSEAYPPPGAAYPPPQGGANPIAPAEAAKPGSGKASISGVIYSFTIHRIIPSTSFYLSRVSSAESKESPPFFAGPEPSRGDIPAKTDAKAQFSLNDIPPGNYYLVVSAPYNWSAVVTSEQDPTPRLIELKTDQSLPLGVLYVSWP